MLHVPTRALQKKNAETSTMHSAEARLVPVLLSISKSMRALQGMKLAELGFHQGQDELLLAIDDAGTTVSLLAERMCVRPSTVSKMMDRLVAKGLLERISDNRDARRTIVRITPSGICAREEVVEARSRFEHELQKLFGGERSPSIGESLATCQTILSSRLQRLR